MHLPVPQLPLSPLLNRTDTAARLSVDLASVVAGARRRALRDGDGEVDTAHLLHSLMQTDAGVRAAFDGPGRTARVLGYLVQRSIGYGLRWRGSVEFSGGAVAAVGAAGVAGWSPSASAAMDRALERAALRGDPRAAGLDLLGAMVEDRDCRAVEVLEHAGVDSAWLGGRIHALSQQV